MIFYTPDKSVLMDVSSVEPHPDGIQISGKIMGTMPMKAVLRPEELRAGMAFLKPSLIGALLAMLFRKAVKPAAKPKPLAKRK